MDRAFTRLLATLIVLAAFLFFSTPFQSAVQAATISLTTDDPLINADGQCSLIEAIINTNQDDQSGSVDCPTGSGADTIDLNNYTILLTASYADYDGATALPQITDNVTLSNGHLESNSSSALRLMSIGVPGLVTLDTVQMRGGRGEDYSPTNGIAINNSGTLHVINSTLTNAYTRFGTGLSIYNTGTLTIQSSTLAAHEGGSVIFNTGTMQMHNTLVTGNHSRTYATIHNHIDAQAEIVNSTISGNLTGSYLQLDDGGGAVYNDSHLTMYNSIVWANRGGIHAGYDATVTTVEYSLVQNEIAGTGNRSVGPGFVNPVQYDNAPTLAGDYRLREASTAIDSASNSHASAAGIGSADRSGNSRFVDDTGIVDRGEGTAPIIDAGAYEYQQVSCTAYQAAGFTPYVLGTVNSTSLSDDLMLAVACTNGNNTADTIDLNNQTVLLTDIYSPWWAYALPHRVSTSLPEIQTDLTLQNGTLAGNQTDLRPLQVETGGNLTLSGVTVQNTGSGYRSGSTVYATGTLTINNSAFTGHIWLPLWIDNTTVTIQDSTFTNNGIVMRLYTGADASISGSVFSQNTTTPSQPMIRAFNSIFDTTITVEDSLFTGNSAETLIYNEFGETIIRQSVLTGNTTGHLINSYQLTIENSTLASNRNGFILLENSDLDTTGTIVNSIVWGNRWTRFTRMTDRFSVIETYQENAGALDENPRFVNQLAYDLAPATGGDYRLQAASPAIDAGDNATSGLIGSTDFDGMPRFSDDSGIRDRGNGTTPLIDIGAYEFQGTSCTAYSYPHIATGNINDLREAMHCASLNTTSPDVIDLNGNSYLVTTASDEMPSSVTVLPRVSDAIHLRNGQFQGDKTLRLLYVEPTGHLTLESVTILSAGDSTTIVGGGISEPSAVSNYGTLDILYSLFADNVATLENFGTASIQDSVFMNNVTGSDKSPLINSGTLTIQTSEFTGNGARTAGVLTNRDGTVQISDSVFRGNTSEIRTGAVQNSAGHISVDNSLFSGNYTDGYGGAFYNGLFDTLSTLTITNSTISGNFAPGAGGAIYNTEFSAGTISTVDVVNSIIYGNNTAIGGNAIANVAITYSVIQGGFSGTGNLDVKPQFTQPEPFGNAPTTAGDYRISSSSPAIDSGSNSAVQGTTVGSTDLLNNPRFVDLIAIPDTGEGSAPIIDMGAYEVTPVIVRADVNQDGIVSPTDAIYVINRLAASYYTAIDVNWDGVVNAADVGIIQSQLGNP